MRIPRTRSVRALVVAGGLALGVALVVGIAGASIPQDGVYTGCYLKSGGTLRVIDPSQNCKTSETRITWNEQGPKGPQGPPGPGLVTGYQMVVDHVTVSGTEPAFQTGAGTFCGGKADVYCPSDKQALGGGGQGETRLALYVSKPLWDQNVNRAVGWTVEAYQSAPDPNGMEIWAFATCAYVQP